MKKQPGFFLLLIIPIVICSSCDLIQAGSSQSVNSDGQLSQTEGPPAVDADQTEVKLENIEWSNIWIENANQSEKPRILFVGDSIANGYFSRVSKKLSGEYYLGYYVTSKFVSNPDFQTELITILDRYDFEIIHINNGLHGFDYTIDDYQKGLEELSEILVKHAPETLIIWCMTTPMRLEENLDFLDPLNAEIILRNQTALEIWGEQDVLLFDLYQMMVGHPEYYKNDGVHFNETGREAQAESIAVFIQSSR